MTDADADGEGDVGATDEQLRRLYEHLAATAKRPVERDASRWLGEAEAVARDLAEGDPSDAVIQKRLGTVAELLAEVSGTGDADADEHVAAARELVSALRER